MRLRALVSILRKEMLETLRDRRTIVAMVVFPAVLYPLMIVASGSIIAANQTRAEQQTPTIDIWGPMPPAVEDAVTRELEPRVRMRRPQGPADPASAARRLLDAGRVDLVMAAKPAADGQQVTVQLYSKDTEALSRLASEEATAALRTASDRLLSRRLSESGLPSTFGKPISVEATDLATAEQRGGDFVSRLLPLLLLQMIVIGALYPAIDVTAGEKERGTMQTLLVAPVHPVEIIAGKYITVVTVAVMSALVNLASMTVVLITQQDNLGAGGLRIAVGVGQLAGVLAMLVPTAGLVAAALMVAGVFARSFREGQNYGTPVMIITLMAGFSAFSDIELSRSYAFVPLVNVTLAIRDLLRGDLVADVTWLVVVANALYATGAVVFCARVFESEQVLLSGERPWRDVRFRRLGGAVPTGRGAVLFAVTLLVAVYYGSVLAPRTSFAGSVLLTQVGLLLVPALLFVAAGRFSFRRTLWLHLPRPPGWAGILLVSAGGWTVGLGAGRAADAIFGQAADYYRSLGELLGAGTAGFSLPVAVALIAVLPAISEEICFRGLILSGLRSTGTAVGAVAGSAALFGAFHLSPYHAIPAAATGVVLALAVLWSRSLIAGVLPHAVNNTLATLGARRPETIEALDAPVVIALGALSLVAGLVILRAGAHSVSEKAPGAQSGSTSTSG